MISSLPRKFYMDDTLLRSTIANVQDTFNVFEEGLLKEYFQEVHNCDIEKVQQQVNNLQLKGFERIVQGNTTTYYFKGDVFLRIWSGLVHDEYRHYAAKDWRM